MTFRQPPTPIPSPRGGGEVPVADLAQRLCQRLLEAAAVHAARGRGQRLAIGGQPGAGRSLGEIEGLESDVHRVLRACGS